MRKNLTCFLSFPHYLLIPPIPLPIPLTSFSSQIAFHPFSCSMCIFFTVYILHNREHMPFVFLSVSNAV